MNTKKPWASKKVWFNTLTIILTVATSFGFTPDKDTTDMVTAGLLVAAPFINWILSVFYTKKSISM